MNDYYYYDHSIREKLKCIIVTLCVFFVPFFTWMSIISNRVLRIGNSEVCIAKNEECEHCVTSILCELDSLAKFEVSDSLALSLMDDLDVQHPQFVLAQMKLESGHYQSKLAKENNNYFGMRHPAQRLTVSTKSKNGYAYYRNWAFSILDYALWQRRYAYDLTDKEYLEKLGQVYAEDKNYILKVKNIAKNLEYLQ